MNKPADPLGSSQAQPSPAKPLAYGLDGLDGLVKRLGLAWLGLPFSRRIQAESSRDPSLKPSRPKPSSAWLGLACLF